MVIAQGSCCFVETQEFEMQLVGEERRYEDKREIFLNDTIIIFILALTPTLPLSLK